MKLSVLLVTTLAVGLAVAYPRPNQDVTNKVHLERLNRFLGMLPEDLRQEVENAFRWAVANGERPQISEEQRNNIREHMAGLKNIHQDKYNRFLSMLPEDLRLEVEALIQQSATNGELPRAPEELRNKIREHFTALKETRRQRLDKFVSMLPEDLRQEVELLLQRPLIDGERPHAPEELRNKIREHFGNLKEAHSERLDKFMDLLPEDLRMEVESLIQQSATNGEHPRAPEELRNKIREHFNALKEARKERLDKFVSMLPEDLRQEVELLLQQPLINGERPRAPEDLRNKIREHFGDLKEAHREQLSIFMDMVPEELRLVVEALIQQSAANRELPHASEELRSKIQEHFGNLKEYHVERLNKFLSLLSEDLRQEVEALMEQASANGEYPRASEELRNKIRQHFTALKEARKQRLDKFLSMMPEDLRQEVEFLLQQPLINGERPRAPEELRNKIREHFGDQEVPTAAYRDQFTLLTNLLPLGLRQELEAEFAQGPVNGPRPSEELRTKLREYFWRLLPAGLKEQLAAVFQQAQDTGTFPEMSKNLRDGLRQFLQLLRTPQLH